jgi:hypothetical protein
LRAPFHISDTFFFIQHYFRFDTAGAIFALLFFAEAFALFRFRHFFAAAITPFSPFSLIFFSFATCHCAIVSPPFRQMPIFSPACHYFQSADDSFFLLIDYFAADTPLPRCICTAPR